MTLPQRYAVIGNPVAHSRSPQIHALFAAQCDVAIRYERLLAPLDRFEDTLRQFMATGACGANVTVPFKLEAHRLADALSARAAAAGAVNTLRFDEGRLYGDNTDGIGLVNDIQRHAGVALADRRILLLGAGGAARGALMPLLHERPACVVIANRSVDKAHALVAQFHGAGTVQASAFDALDGCFDVIINATSASLTAALPPLAPTLFGAQTLAYDMMYGARPTRFMEFASQHGANTRDGLGMLVEQAAEAFYVWRGVRPASAPVLQALRALIQAETAPG